jgi:hypothetical protein
MHINHAGRSCRLIINLVCRHALYANVSGHAMKDRIDIEEIIKLVQGQEPARQDIIAALRNCKGGHWYSSGYYNFVDSRNANQTGSEWQHDECIVLEQQNQGDIVIDLLKDGRIGGIEFIDLIDK